MASLSVDALSIKILRFILASFLLLIPIHFLCADPIVCQSATSNSVSMQVIYGDPNNQYQQGGLSERNVCADTQGETPDLSRPHIAIASSFQIAKSFGPNAGRVDSVYFSFVQDPSGLSNGTGSNPTPNFDSSAPSSPPPAAQ